MAFLWQLGFQNTNEIWLSRPQSNAWGGQVGILLRIHVLMQMEQFVHCELGEGPQTPRDVSTAAAGAHCYIMEKPRLPMLSSWHAEWFAAACHHHDGGRVKAASIRYCTSIGTELGQKEREKTGRSKKSKKKRKKRRSKGGQQRSKRGKEGNRELTKDQEETEREGGTKVERRG